MILFSKHAREQMVARGISATAVEEAIAKGAKQLQYPNKILYHYRYFTVVTKKLNNNDYVITVKPRW